MKLAIIGAGPSGLGVLKEAISSNFECTVFEQSDKIGGLWNYSEDIHNNVNGLPIHSAIYEGMVTSAPKEIMSFEDFPYVEPNNSFIKHQEVLKYIQEFANHFELSKYIQLNTQVIFVQPVECSKWLVRSKNLQTMEIDESIFDAVTVCNGHLFKPHSPVIPGTDAFDGTIIHSYIYRKPDVFKDKTVLVIGAGPSGRDISRILATVAKKVIICFKEKPQCPVDSILSQKSSSVRFFTETSAVFQDGSEEIVDAVIFCTGFETIFPFLAPECGITVEDNWVKPLYKHIINIDHPTMAIINITDITLTFPLSGLQARFFIASLKNKFHKTKEEMLQDLNEEIKVRREKGVSLRYSHFLGPALMKAYCEELSATAGIKNMKPVINEIFAHYYCHGFRSHNYRIVNDEEFETF